MSTIITKKQFPNYRKYTMELAGRPLTLETGKLAELANAFCRLSLLFPFSPTQNFSILGLDFCLQDFFFIDHRNI